MRLSVEWLMVQGETEASLKRKTELTLTGKKEKSEDELNEEKEASQSDKIPVSFTFINRHLNLHLPVLRRLCLSHQSQLGLESTSLDGLRHLSDSLVHLDLSHCQLLDHRHASSIGKLTKLVVLNVSYNRMKTVHKSWRQLTALKALIMSHNELKVLSEIDAMTELNTLIISHNALTLLDSKLFSSLSQLKKINANFNQITALPFCRRAGHSLYELLFQSNKITSIEDTWPLQHPHVTLLDLSHNPLTIASLASLVALKRLNQVDVRECGLNDMEMEIVRETVFPMARRVNGKKVEPLRKPEIKEPRKRKMREENEEKIKESKVKIEENEEKMKENQVINQVEENKKEIKVNTQIELNNQVEVNTQLNGVEENNQQIIESKPSKKSKKVHHSPIQVADPKKLISGVVAVQQKRSLSSHAIDPSALQPTSWSTSAWD